MTWTARLVIHLYFYRAYFEKTCHCLTRFNCVVKCVLACLLRTNRTTFMISPARHLSSMYSRQTFARRVRLLVAPSDGARPLSRTTLCACASFRVRGRIFFSRPLARTLVDLRHALAARAHSRLTRCRSMVEGGKLAVEEGPPFRFNPVSDSSSTTTLRRAFGRLPQPDHDRASSVTQRQKPKTCL